MSKELSDLHTLPWGEIRGAYVKVNQETTELPASPDELLNEHPENRHTTETREGNIIGRGQGRGVAYDSGERASKPISIGPSIYLDTPEDTVLEVRTDKVENELLEFNP